MIWILFLLAHAPARAEAPHFPAEMHQKYEDVSVALRQGYAEAQKKLRQSQKNSDLAHSITDGIAKLWAGAKAKGCRALVYFDHQLHEHVLGNEHESSKAQ